jgi:uncharacterized protein (TIGR00369 family)
MPSKPPSRPPRKSSRKPASAAGKTAPPRPRPPARVLATYAEHFNASETLRHFNVRVSFPPGGEEVVVHLDVQPHHEGGLGTRAVNGGVIAAIFDLAIGCTAALVDPTRRSATMQLSMTFMRPVLGPNVQARARIDRAGSAVLFSSASVVDKEGRVCAACTGMVRLSQEVWASGKSPAIN